MKIRPTGIVSFVTKIQKLAPAAALILASAAAICFTPAAFATSASWTGSTSALWSASGNWSGSPVVVPGTNDAATFNGAGNANTTIDLTGGVTISNIVFDTSSAAVYTIGAGGAGAQTLVINSNSLVMVTPSATNQLFNAVLNLGLGAGANSFTISNGSPAGLTLAGGITTAQTGTKTVTFNGPGTNLISGSITNGSGGIALVKGFTGGVVILGGSNFLNAISFSGGVNAGDNGSFRLTSSNALNGATVTMGGQNGTLQTIEFANNIIITNNISTGSRTAGNAQLRNVSGTNIYAGAFTAISTGGGETFESASGRLTLTGSFAQTAGSARALQIQGAGSGVITYPLAGGNLSALTMTGPGTWTLSGSNNFTGGTTFSAGTLVMANTNALGSGLVTISGTANATVDIATDGSDLTNSYTVGSGVIFTLASDVKTGSVGLNHNIGIINLGSGSPAMQMNVTRGPNVASGSPAITTAAMTLSGGTGGTTIINPTNASVTISNITATATAKTLQLDGTSTGNSIVGFITNSAVALSVTKANTSTWTLGGPNTYSGTTTISNGNLTVTGRIGSNTVTVVGGTLAFGGSGTLSNGTFLVVNGGSTLDVSAASGTILGAGTTLSGSGTVVGNFPDSTGAIFLPGGNAAIGTLTFNNNLTLGGGATIKYDFNGGTNDVMAVGGNLSPSGTTTINLASGANSIVNGDYALILVTNTLGGSAGNFTISGQPSPSRQSFSITYDNVSSPKRVLLHVTGSAGNLLWKGGLAGNIWDITTTQNWTNTGTLGSDVYFDGDIVSFTDFGSANQPVLNTAVQPGSVTFNSANTYALTGTGTINGGTGLTKAGAGTLTVSTVNNYIGPTAINGGVLSIATITNSGFPSPIGAASSAPANLSFNGGTLQYTTGDNPVTDHGATLNPGGGNIQVSSAAATLVLGGSVVGTGGGALTKSGAGTLVLAGNNAYDGSTVVSAGVLQVGNGGATGSLGGGLITDNSAIVALRTGTLTVTNNIGGTGTITNNGTGTLVLGGTNTYTGSTTINTGIVQVVSGSALGSTPLAFDPAHINIGVGELEASTSFSLSDTNTGVSVNAGTIGVDSGMTLIISNQVNVATSLTKALPGTLILSGSNVIAGLLNVDTGSTTASDGVLRVTSTNALGGVTTIQIRNGQIPGSSTLQLDGTQGGIEYDQAVIWTGRNNLVPAIENLAGKNVWNASTATLNVGGPYYMFQSDAGLLTLTATFPTTVPATGRIVIFGGVGNTAITGTLQDGSGGGLIGVLKTNTGALTYWTQQTYSGLTTVAGGTLNVADSAGFGNSATNIEIAPLPGETAVLNISNATVNAQRIVVAGITGNNTAPGNGTINQYNLGTVNASQWVTVGSGGTSGGVGTYNLTDSTLNVLNTAGGTQLEIANFIGSSGTFNLGGPLGAAVLSIQNNAYIALGANAGAGNGTFNQNSGAVTFFSDAGGTVGGNGILYLGKATGLTSNYVYNLSGGTLTVPTITSTSGNSYFHFNGGTLVAAKTNAAFMSGLTATFIGPAPAIIDSVTYPITISQPLLHDPVLSVLTDGGLTSQSSGGVGILTLTGTNTYTGPTVINSGVLNINGSIGTGAVTINGGTLGGLGVINGATTLVSGTNAPGGSGVIGTLTISNNLTLQGGTVQFDLARSSNDVLAVSGTVNAAAATTLLLTFPSPTVGTYTLISYGSFSGSLGNLSLALTSPNPRFTYTLQNNTAAKVIQLVVTGNSANLVWKGDGGFNGWDDAGVYQNWLKSGNADYFYDGDVVTFDNTGNNSPVDIQGTVLPGSVTVNSTQNYDFANNGGIIAGAGTLAKFGSSTLIIENNNTYTGTTIISNGIVQIGNGGTSGSLGSGVITNNASLVLDRSDAIVLPSPIYGSGSVSVAAASTSVTAAGSNYYTGPTTINAGILHLHNAAGLGATNGIVTVATGAQLFMDLNVDNGGNPLSLIGTGDGNGALHKGGAGVSTYNGAVSLTGDTSLSVDGGATLNLPSGLAGAAANANLTLLGSGAGNFTGPLLLGTGGLTVTSGTWTLGASNNFTGLTALNGGTTRINDGTLGSPATFTANQITLGGGTLEAATNALLIDGKAGLTLTANSTLAVDTGSTLTISNLITGGNALTKSLPGTLLLKGSNAFNGTLNLDSGSNSGNDGAVYLTTSNAIINAVSPINSRNNNGGSSILQLDGSAGAISIPQDFSVACRNSGVPWIENIAGNNILTGAINVNVGGGTLLFQSDAGQLELAGQLSYVGTLTGGRILTFTGAGNLLVSGSINSSANGAPIGVAVNGPGRVTLSAVNTYTNTTTVANGTLLVSGSINSSAGVTVTGGILGGTGTINDNVSVGSAGTLSPGTSGIGTLTISSNLALAGTTYIEVSKTAGTSDQVTGLTGVTYGGTLFATNLAGTLNVGDSFPVFSTAAHTGSFASVTGTPGPGKVWSFNTASGVLSVITGVNQTPTNLVATISGKTLTLSWPVDHTGWRLLVQTNSLSTGLNPATNAWFTVPGSTLVNSNVITLNPGNGAVFYRMVYP